MNPNESPEFRLTVLNPGGRDGAQNFSAGAGEPGPDHAPVNFHAFAACTRGTFKRESKAAVAQNTPVLLLLRGDFKASQQALTQLKNEERTVAISLKETGRHQIAQQLRDANKLGRFLKIVSMADGCIGTTTEAADFFCSAKHGDPSRVAFVPTPYPVDDARWDFSRSTAERSGIFVGTREWNVPSRNHLAALLLAREVSEATGESVTVFNSDGRGGTRLLADLNFRPKQVRVMERVLPYPDYLREVSRHKIVLQLDTSAVPGQVAGDSLLCRNICVGGDGAIDRIAFSETCGLARSIEELRIIALRLLQNADAYEQAIVSSQRRAQTELSFAAIAKRLENFFAQISA